MTIDPDEAERVIADLDADPDVLLAVFADTSHTPEVRDRAFNHPAVSDSVVMRLIEQADADRSPLLVARCERPGVLRWLATSDVVEVRSVVAFNPATPAHVVDELSRDDEPGVRSNAALNPRVSPAALEFLGEDPDDDVRDWVSWARTTEQGRRARAGMRYAVVDGDVE